MREERVKKNNKSEKLMSYQMIDVLERERERESERNNWEMTSREIEGEKKFEGKGKIQTKCNRSQYCSVIVKMPKDSRKSKWPKTTQFFFSKEVEGVSCFEFLTKMVFLAILAM